MTVSFYTLGCKVNQYESEAISEIFEKNGYTVLPPDSGSDIVIINSCTVTAESSRKTRQSVRRLRKLNPGSVIVLTGCMAQAFPEEAESITEADIVIGNTDYDKLYDVCEKYMSDRKRICACTPHTKNEKYTNLTVSRFSEHTRSYIKIEDGCDRFCSYCIIPYARGRVRSKQINIIYSEAGSLAAAGYREIVLVGINLSAFGKDSGAELCDAVEAVAMHDGIERIRLGSLECDQISDRALDRLAGCEKFCPQFHLSLQSGCDKTLKEMNRKYDTAFYRDLVERIRVRFKNPSITTDIMVGFPGETDEDFMASREFVKDIGFARSHVFIYSEREGTIAAKRADRIDPITKQQRSKIMLSACAEAENSFLQAQVGKTSKVLFEDGENGFWEGYTENYTRVRVSSAAELTGRILTVKLISAGNGFCEGYITDSE